MGGPGSGRTAWSTRRTVEVSLTLDLADFSHLVRLAPTGDLAEVAGTFVWWRGWEAEPWARVQFAILPAHGLVLAYRAAAGPSLTPVIPLVSTRLHRGGRRWWLTCPVERDDEACGRRARTLHLPPGARAFGCRACHDLAFRSQREDWSPFGMSEAVWRVLTGPRQCCVAQVDPPDGARAA